MLIDNSALNGGSAYSGQRAIQPIGEQAFKEKFPRSSLIGVTREARRARNTRRNPNAQTNARAALLAQTKSLAQTVVAFEHPTRIWPMSRYQISTVSMASGLQMRREVHDIRRVKFAAVGATALLLLGYAGVHEITKSGNTNPGSGITIPAPTTDQQQPPAAPPQLSRVPQIPPVQIG